MSIFIYYLEDETPGVFFWEHLFHPRSVFWLLTQNPWVWSTQNHIWTCIVYIQCVLHKIFHYSTIQNGCHIQDGCHFNKKNRHFATKQLLAWRCTFVGATKWRVIFFYWFQTYPLSRIFLQIYPLFSPKINPLFFLFKFIPYQNCKVLGRPVGIM